MVKQVNCGTQTDEFEDERLQELLDENTKLREDNQTLFGQVQAQEYQEQVIQDLQQQNQ